MQTPRVLVLRTAGTNCDEETAHAWRLAGAEPVSLHVQALMHDPSQLDPFAILTIPGGFSYGDDISAGKILAQQLIHHLADPLRDFVGRGGLILGICNGFQVLVKAGLLPGWSSQAGRQAVTLTQNDSARFETRWIHMRTGDRASAFLPAGLTITLPIAHGEGKLVAADDEVRNRLRAGGHISLTYCDEAGRPGPYPINPNGSEDDIAGLCDETGRVLGLMPHPERYVDPLQHPAAARYHDRRPDGRIFFESAVAHARSL
jgi:phosphoribosylformylglycinamidine synthase subunit PurQ / glutaminase